MSHAIAERPKEFYPYLVAPTFKRAKTPNYETNALATLKDYRRYAQITEDEYKDLKKEIKAAPHDDAVANIMSKLRRKVYG